MGVEDYREFSGYWSGSFSGRPSGAAEVGPVVRLRPRGEPGDLVADNGTRWSRIGSPLAGEKDAERRRILNTKITYVCAAASKKSGLPPWQHAGVPERTFKEWEKDRNFFYWPPDETSSAVEERMLLDGYASRHYAKNTDNGEDLLTAIGEAAIEGYKLYRLAAAAHGIVHPG